MNDTYLIRYITEFLKLCSSCNCYDTYNYNKSCCICKKFYCSKCVSKLYSNFSFYESLYCEECNSTIYNIYN